MKKFRIITNGKKFRVQVRKFLFFWFLETYDKFTGTHYVEFEDKEKAIEYIETLKKARKLKNWKVIG